jgi:hypothetical protein
MSLNQPPADLGANIDQPFKKGAADLPGIIFLYQKTLEIQRILKYFFEFCDYFLKLQWN